MGNIMASYSVNIIRTPKRRSFKLEIDNQVNITLRVPNATSKEDIKNFIDSNADWIEQTITKVEAKPQFIRKYEPSEQFLFLGQTYPLVYSSEANHIFKYDGERFVVSENITNIKHYFENFYKAKARTIIKARVIDIASKLGIKFNKLRITSATSRWGSCNSRGNVNFSWRLIMAPPMVIDYVIIHEFCHLFEFNHSKKFWALVERMMPDYRTQKKWLETNSIYMLL
jgi:predicted metal-dependent hydrolase